jgi:hypothetical protein
MHEGRGVTKYGAKSVVLDGHRFPSKAEAKRYGELKLLQKAGEITGLELQPKFPLVLPNGAEILIRSDRYPNGRKAVYRADFAYFTPARRVVEEVKGMDTMESRLRRAVVEAIYGIRIEVIR